MSKVIPKEQLTAYQRWELAAFEEVAHPSSLHQRLAEEEEPPIRLGLPTAEELERLHQEAWQEGYNLGREEGRKAGFEAGSKDSADYLQQLDTLVEALDLGRLRQEDEIAREVLELAIRVANQIVLGGIRAKPELILETVKEALRSLPTLNGHQRIVVHPDSAELVRHWLAKEHGHLSWKVTEDSQMELGGFRLESANSELDASMATRWQEVVACLGADPRWLD